MTDADIVRERINASVNHALNGKAEEALDRLLARAAERERDEAREDAANARGYLEAVRVMRDRYEARYEKHRQRAEAAERERDTLREALEAAVALYATPEPECSTDEYARLEKAMQAGLAAVSPPQEGGDGLYIDHSLAVVKFPSPPQEGEA